MKISVNWLKEWVELPVDAAELAQQFTMAGLEVDSITPAAPAFMNVVVGRVVSVHRHPGADKLRLCKVDVGGARPLMIVCGAANVRQDMKTAVAQVGAVLPGDREIVLSSIRDVDSEGMLCSEQELGMAETSDGLLELPADAPVGQSLRDYLDLDDQIIEVDLTPNRGDCLGMAGIAREVGVYNRVTVSAPAFKAPRPAIRDTHEISLKAPEGCPRYLGRVIRGVDPQAVTPLWMQERLRRCGIRALSPLVDVTNYVLLELGQPMHAFDLDRLEGAVQIRYASKGEPITLLDGKTLKLDADTLLIADDRGPLALAGIMGGEHSGISATTTNVFLECAFFSPKVVAGRARRYGLHTDSSFRFERGVDPQLQARAMERATQLLLEIAGGRAGPVTEVSSDALARMRPAIRLRAARLKTLLGVRLPAAEITDILRRLGMKVTAVKGRKEQWQVVPPSYRFDIECEADLIEEVGRIHGYDAIPSRAPSGRLQIEARPEARVSVQRIKERLVDRGYQEAVTYSFVDASLQQQLNPEARAVALKNPMSADMAVMRTTLWTGLLQVVRYNLNRQQRSVRIFETGLSFVEQDDQIIQENRIAGAVCGTLLPEQWGERSREVDFFDLKGDVEALFDLAGSRVRFVAAAHPALHPGQSAQLVDSAGQVIGWLGRIHPEVIKKQDLSSDVHVFELDLEALQQGRIPKFQALSRFPSIRRDIAIVVDEAITSEQVCNTIRQTIPEQLKEIRLFDVYRGKGVDSGRKSFALGLILQESSRTLVDQEADAAVEWVLVQLEKELGASLRD